MTIGLFDVRVCPSCGSTNLKGSSLLDSQEISRVKAYSFQMNTDMFLCKDCGYFGVCPEVNPKDVKKFTGNLKKTKKISKNQKSKVNFKKKSRVQKITFMSRIELILMFIVIIVFVLAQFFDKLKYYAFVAIVLFVIYILIAHKTFSDNSN